MTTAPIEPAEGEPKVCDLTGCRTRDLWLLSRTRYQLRYAARHACRHACIYVAIYLKTWIKVNEFSIPLTLVSQCILLYHKTSYCSYARPAQPGPIR